MYHNPYEEDDTQDNDSNILIGTAAFLGKLVLIATVMGLLAYATGAAQCFGS